MPKYSFIHLLTRLLIHSVIRSVCAERNEQTTKQTSTKKEKFLLKSLQQKKRARKTTFFIFLIKQRRRIRKVFNILCIYFAQHFCMLTWLNDKLIFILFSFARSALCLLIFTHAVADIVVDTVIVACRRTKLLHQITRGAHTNRSK